MTTGESDPSTIYQRPVELLQQLIRFDTTNPPGNEAECIRYVNDLLTAAGFETKVLALDAQRPNLIARLAGEGNAPPLLLQGHVDVVTTANQEWAHPPFEAELADGCVWGRGALDMKGGVVMMLAAFLKARAEGLTPAGDVVLALLSDEEAGSAYGARYLVESHPEQFEGIRYAIGEFGGFTLPIGRKMFYPIGVAEKQVCWMRTWVRGPGGHGSLPMRGGAMARLARLLSQLDHHRLPVHITPVVSEMVRSASGALPFPSSLVLRLLLNPLLTDALLALMGARGDLFDPLLHNTVNATMVHGGEQVNVIPSSLEVSLDGRLLPGYGPEDLIVELRQLLGDEAEFEVIQYDHGLAEPDMGLFDVLGGILREGDPDSVPLPILFAAVTDGRFFSRLGIQTYGFTPMKLPAEFGFSLIVHAADERIPVEALEFGCDAIYKVLQRFGRG